MPDNALFQGYFAEVSFGTPPNEISSYIFKIAIFPKLFWAFIKNITR